MANSYKDPFYDKVDSDVTKQLGLPAGLLSNIRLKGERSNADQVSSAGARSVYQITPTTRKLALAKYGVDAYNSPEDAAKVAGLLLQESLQRNKGDQASAVREYIGGTNPANHGPVTDAYVKRVTGTDSKAWSADELAKMASKPAQAWTADQLLKLANKSQPKQQGQGADSGIGSALSRGARDVLEGAAQGVGTLVDPLIGAIGAGVRMIPGQEGYQPATLEGTASSVADALGLEIAATPEQQIISQINRGGVGALYGAGLAKAASGLASSASPVVRGAIAEMAASPFSQAIGGAAAGGASEMARQSGAGELGSIAAGLAGGIVGGAGAASSGRLARSAASIAQQAAQKAAPAVQAARQAVQRASPVKSGSVGAAATPEALQRTVQAEQLPVPVQLTKGQAGRDFADVQFERETAKLPEVGKPLRERYAQQNEQVMQNFDAWIDESGAIAPDLRAVGKAVDQAIVNKSKNAKAKIRQAYKDAEQAGELEQPIEVPALAAHLNDAIPEIATAPVLDTAIKKAVQLGLVDQAADGSLIPKQAPLKNVEAFRQAMNRASDPMDAPNMRQIQIMKGLVDDATEGAGGDVYKYARRLRKDYANEFENRAVVSRLLRNKPGTNDRAVALEDVYKKSIIDGSLDDVRHLRRTLQTAGEEGQQAWKEVQGQAMKQLRDEAFGNSARDERGNPILSAAALDRRVKSLDADGKLDFIFGKKGAEQIRTMNDLAKMIYTAPPGAVNTSNTASALRVALDAMVTGTITGIPAPAATALRALAIKIKDRKLAKRVQEALKGVNRF